MASTADMSRVLHMLRSLYPYVQTLEEFTDGIVFREGRKVHVFEEGDSERFKSSVRDVYVCTDTKLQQVPSCNQICTLPEVLAFVLNNLKRKKRRNVLTHGYSSSFSAVAQQERDLDQFKYQGDVIQSAAYIHGSTLWRRLLKRLGTDITKYLLESCALFVSVPPSCVFQLCGVPVYDRVSVAPGSRFCRHPRTRNRTNAGGKLSERKTGERTNGGKEKRNKRKRGRCAEEEQCLTRPAKRPRTGDVGLTEMTQQGCGETANNDVQLGAAETAAAITPSEAARGDNSKQAVQMPPASSLTLDGGPSWRSGRFPPLRATQCFIRMFGMLYGGRGMRGFHLNRKKRGGAEGPRRIQGSDLVRIIFFEGVAYLNGLERKPKKLPLRFFNAVPLFSRLLRRHRSCPYDRILHRMCPLAKDGQGDLSSLLPQHCAPHRVYLFIRECLSKVVPQELWGSDHNKAIFLTRVRGFLRNGKNERLSLAELMWKVKVNDCDWLKISKTGRVPPCELAYRTQVLGQYLAWLLDGYVLGLVRAHFYVTESTGQKHALRFYRQEVWAKLQDVAFRAHLTKGQMEELTPNEVASLPKDTVTSRLRFIPKPEGMRPITRIIGADIKTRLYQGRVRTLLDVLRACVRRNPSLLGATVHGNTDIHKVLRSLAPGQKDMPQPLYFVKVDVSGAYESLPHAKLLDVIRDVLSPVQDEALNLRRYAKIWKDAFDGLKKSFVNWADFLDEESCNMKGFVMKLQREGKVKNTILVEQTYDSDLTSRDSLKSFTHMLNGTVIQYMKRTFRQCRGIPQGSVVSCLLCCLCYAHMEKLLFKNITDNGGCLMRLVDDFLLITPHLHQAETFLQTCLAGVPQYGLVANPQKVLINFKTRASQDVRRLPPQCLFPWCGLLLNTSTLDVYNDYASYAGLSLRYSLTLGFTRSAGQLMRSKMMAVLRLKCHILFLDLKINSVETVYRNLYKLVLLHAYRFHVCAQCLPFGQNVAKNPRYFLQMIWDMAKYTNRLIRLSNKGMCLGTKDQTGVLQYEAVELIYCLSFVVVLTRHRPLYKAMLPLLHRRKRDLERRLGALRLARVRQAATPRMPEEFGAILTLWKP